MSENPPEQRRDDDGSLGGRVRRYARVGTAVGGLAARVAGDRLLGRSPEAGDYADDLRRVLGGLKGPVMKAAQILATVPDLLPPEYTAELSQLQTNAPSMGWAFVKRRMASELGPDWRQRFAEFDHEAAAAASLGQVHKALDHDGRRLACKLQYPDMASAVEADLQQLKLGLALFRRYDKVIDPTEIHAELSVRLREELDYRREAANMALFADMLRGEPMVHVPTAVPVLSTGRLLTMDWLDGRRMVDVTEAPLEERNRVAEAMFRAWYVPFYHFGVLHGDPHLGNYTVRTDHGVNLLDFGCIRVFRPSFVGAVIDLYRALRDGDEDLAAHAYETWGFVNLDRNVMRILNQWAAFLYEPLLDDRRRRIQEHGSPTYGASIAAKVHRELSEAGGVKPPREFVLMDRAAIGLGSVFLRLKAELNWHRLFHDLTEGFDAAVVSARQNAALQRSMVPAD
ncbi:MAG: AarF/ABC1/UbiB kinase family protein [Rhodospirillales bacterium]|nr:AarF/ABC1/UbiB kinase family protein [Rhodospirillales bacterium]